jgi:hypothetical protein
VFSVVMLLCLAAYFKLALVLICFMRCSSKKHSLGWEEGITITTMRTRSFAFRFTKIVKVLS